MEDAKIKGKECSGAYFSQVYAHNFSEQNFNISLTDNR